MTISDLWCAYLDNTLDDMLWKSDLSELTVIKNQLEFNMFNANNITLKDSQKPFLNRYKILCDRIKLRLELI